MKFISKNFTYLILAAASASLITSILIWIEGDRDLAMYIGLWVPSILSAGIILKEK